MAEARTSRKFLVILMMLWMSCVSADERYYQAHIAQGIWTYKGGALQCELRQEIPLYGHAKFIRRHGDNDHFILHNNLGLFHKVPVQIGLRAAPWQQELPIQWIANREMQEGSVLLNLDPVLSEGLLLGLRQGQWPHILYEDDHGDPVLITLPAVTFLEAYQKYLSCVNKLFPHAWREVSKTTIYFGLNSSRLGREDKRKLKIMRDFIKISKAIRRVIIRGYADGSGHRIHNIYLSERRAKAVKNFFLDHGIAEDRLRVLWYGIKNPVADNKTKHGRKSNRRVTVELARS